jgi:predicted component of type VI protein secretion system
LKIQFFYENIITVFQFTQRAIENRFACHARFRRLVYTIEKNAENLIVASKDMALEVNVDKTKYMVMSRGKNERRSHSMKIENSSFERVKESNIWEQL